MIQQEHRVREVELAVVVGICRRSAALGERRGSWEAEGEIELALADYDEAIASTPGMVGVLWARAFLYARLGRLDDALLDVEKIRGRRKKLSPDELYNVVVMCEPGDLLQDVLHFDFPLQVRSQATGYSRT